MSSTSIAPSGDPAYNKWSDSDNWDAAATQYNDAVGRSSRLVANRLITLANSLLALSSPSARAIDLGAGTGSLTHQLAASYPALPILATDISVAMLEQLMATRADPGSDTVRTSVMDMANPFAANRSTLDGETSNITEGSFSHVFSTMAIQVLPAPDETGVLEQWARLLTADGVLAIAMWDFDENCGPHALWAEAAVSVNPTYRNPPILPPQHWTGLAQLKRGLETMGFQDIAAEVMEIGFDVGKEGFMRFFWESGNPMATDRMGSWGERGGLDKVKEKMGELLNEKFEGGRKIPLSAALAVGRRPK
ncbi:MAG: hypothetical protein Q9169_006531 [Polycauliona sp. 2 TL-2023]